MSAERPSYPASAPRAAAPAAPEPPTLTTPPPTADIADVASRDLSILYRVCRVPCRIFTTVAFDLKVYGREHIPPTGGVLIASNHQSFLDPMLIGTQLPRALSFLAKSELFENRYFGGLIRSLNAFPVRQGEGDVGAVKETIRRLQEGHALNLYPEGSRCEDGEIGPIQSGVALIVRRAGVPVVPAVIDGSFDAWPKSRKLPRPRPVRVMFGPPMHLSALKGPEIVKRLDATLHAMMAELRAREPVLRKPRRSGGGGGGGGGEERDG